MKTYDEAYASSIDMPAFSNGTEGCAWTANWCDRCTHDQSAHRDDVKPDPRNNGMLGCALLAVAMLGGRTPVEWIDNTADGHRLGDTYHCVEFRPEDGGGDGDDSPTTPTPAPEIDGQVDMFEVFADQIVTEFADDRTAVPA